MRFNLMIFVLFLFVVSFASAGDYAPQKYNENFTFCQICDDATYITLGSIETPNSTEFVNTNMTSQGSGHFCYNYTPTQVGTYDFRGVSDGCTNSWAVFVEVTPNGETINGSRVAMSVIFLGLLGIFFLTSLIGMIKHEHYIGKFTLFWVSYVFLIIICFITWQTSSNYLSMDGGLAGVFKILFYVLIYAVFPLLLSSLSWIFYIHTFNEHFQKAIDKGGKPEDAFKMAKRKSGGWFNGK